MKKLILFLFIFASFFGVANAASTKVVNVDGVSINIPLISSLTEAQDEMIGLLNQMLPSGEEIVIAYITPEDFDRFENYEQPTFTQFVQIINNNSGGGDLSLSEFQKRVAYDKKEYKDIEKTLSKVNALIAKQDTYLSSLSDVDLKNVVDVIIPFPAFIDTNNTYAFTILAAKKQTINGKTKKTGRIITAVGLYINKRILNVGFYLSASETTDISLQEKKVNDWVHAFYKANNSSIDTKAKEAEEKAKEAAEKKQLAEAKAKEAEEKAKQLTEVKRVLPIVHVSFDFIGYTQPKEDIAKIIRDNLTKSGRFATINTNEVITNIIDFDYLQEQKIDTVIFGRIEPASSNVFHVSIYIYDVSSQERLYAQKIAFTENAFRRVAHALSDKIYYVLLGEEVSFEAEQAALEAKIKNQEIILKNAWVNNIAAEVKSVWNFPGAEDGWFVEVLVTQNKEGKVLNVKFGDNNVGDSVIAKRFIDSVERAIYKSSPLPIAPDVSVWDKNIMFTFRAD